MPGNSLVRLFRTGAVTPSALEQVNQAPLAQGGGTQSQGEIVPGGEEANGSGEGPGRAGELIRADESTYEERKRGA